MTTLELGQLRPLANAIRALSMDGVEKAKSGHPGMPMGMADAATVLFARHLKFDPTAPRWPDRDRFVLSAGHGSMLLYSLLHLTGYADMTLEQIKNFRQLGSICAGHPEYGHVMGAETTTGPLGQGIANAVGFAMAESHLRGRFGADLVDHYTWVIAGDGCLMEGISHEAISLAGRQKLNRLIVIWDDNSISIDGAVSVSDHTDQPARFRAAGWKVISCDGHDMDSIEAALTAAKAPGDQPVLIACKTVIGYGAPKKAGTKSAHGEALGAEELAAAKAALGWPYGPFEVPDDIRALWLGIGARGKAPHAAWDARLAASDHRAAFEAAMSGEVPAAAKDALKALAEKQAAEKPALATRTSSGASLDAVFPHYLEMVGGSADLTPSNNTYVKGTTAFMPETPAGRYVHYGVREHAMAAAMNGMALHGGVVPYGGTFLVFADYARPAIRLAALMGIRVVFVMTHDSIGLGEDGPTHQPVEHLASLRAIPGLYVFRPGDAVEAAESWSCALSMQDRPSLLALSRQAMPTVRTSAAINQTAFGAYELAAAEGGEADVSLFATGSEVGIAMDARAKLAAEGVKARVVSVPCWELFLDQSPAYRQSIVGNAPRIVIEAGIAQGWSELVGPNEFVGMSSFGASGPIKDLYPHFGITADHVVALAQKLA